MKSLLAWVPAALLLLFGIGHVVAAPEQPLPVEPIPVQMTVGQSVEVTFDPAPDAGDGYSSDPSVVEIQKHAQKDEHAVYELTAHAAGSASISCTTENASSPSYSISVVAPEEPPLPAATSGAYVASKSGSKYHLPSCSSAKQIKTENQVFFQTPQQAEEQGYAPCARCLGA